MESKPPDDEQTTDDESENTGSKKTGASDLTPTERYYRWERRQRRREPLDFAPSSTAVDPRDAAQDESTETRTGRHSYTENATFTKEPMEASSYRWETLNQANRDFYADDETDVKQAQREQDWRNDVIAWGRQIGLTDYECRRGADLATAELNSGLGGIAKEALALATLTIAANESHPVQPKTIRPSSDIDVEDVDTEQLQDNYEQIRTDLGIDTKSVRSARQTIRETMLRVVTGNTPSP